MLTSMQTGAWPAEILWTLGMVASGTIFSVILVPPIDADGWIDMTYVAVKHLLAFLGGAALFALVWAWILG